MQDVCVGHGCRTCVYFVCVGRVYRTCVKDVCVGRVCRESKEGKVFYGQETSSG